MFVALALDASTVCLGSCSAQTASHLRSPVSFAHARCPDPAVNERRRTPCSPQASPESTALDDESCSHAGIWSLAETRPQITTLISCQRTQAARHAGQASGLPGHGRSSSPTRPTETSSHLTSKTLKPQTPHLSHHISLHSPRFGKRALSRTVCREARSISTLIRAATADDANLLTSQVGLRGLRPGSVSGSMLEVGLDELPAVLIAWWSYRMPG